MMKKPLCAALGFLLLTACTEIDDVVGATGSALVKTKEALKKADAPAPAHEAVAGAVPVNTVQPDAAPPAAAPVPPTATPVVWVTPAPQGPETAAPPALHPFDMGEEIPSGPPQKADRRVEAEPLPAPPPLPAPVKYKADHAPMIAIVIDDMGLDRKRSAWATDLPANITLSYLPYAPHIEDQVDDAIANGHEIILHMPMQAMRKGEVPGRYGLFVDMPADQIRQNTNAALDAFSGYVGVNNHMGSKFTSDRAGMETFMAELEKRNVFFLDSKTASTSVAEEVARAHHLPATHRDIFIDHTETAEFVAAALNHAEDLARATGSAIAIGHPKDVTLASLEVWMEGLEGRGFQIVPLSQVVKYRNKMADTIAGIHNK